MQIFIAWYKKYKKLSALLKASFWFLICSFLQKGISIITTPIFTRLLTPAEYGLFSIFTSWLSIVAVIVTLNLFGGTYIQGLVKFDDHRSQYSSAMQGLSLTLVVIWSVVYFLFHNFWDELLSLTTVQIMAMFVIIWTSSVFNFWAAEQRVDYKYLKLVVITLLVSVAKPALGVFLVIHAEDKVTARILGLAIVELATFTWLFFAQMLRGRQFYSWKIWKYALMFNIPIMPHYLSGAILNTADRIMIEKWVCASAAGIYSLACSISFIMTLFNTSILQTIEPWLYKKIKAREITSIAHIAYPAFIIIAGVNIMLIACAPEVVAVFAPKVYHDAIWIIPPVAMSSYFMFAYTFFAVFEFYYEKTYLIATATMVGAILKLALNYLFIDVFGYIAAGYTTLFCFMIYALLHYCFMQKICKEYLNDAQAYNTKSLLLITLTFLALGFVILTTYKRPMLRYSLIVILAQVVLIKRKYIFNALKNLVNTKK